MTPLGGEDGSALVVSAVALVIACMVSLVLVDVVALHRATLTARAAADAAALAAAQTSWDVHAGAASRAAGAVAEANGARMLDCSCRRQPVEVAVEVAFASLLLERVGVDAVRASATATMVRR